MVVKLILWYEAQNYFFQKKTGSILGSATEKSGYIK